MRGTSNTRESSRINTVRSSKTNKLLTMKNNKKRSKSRGIIKLTKNLTKCKIWLNKRKKLTMVMVKSKGTIKSWRSKMKNQNTPMMESFNPNL